MHENANITFQNQESAKLIETIISIQPRIASSGSSGKSSNDIVIELAKELESKLPPLLDKSTAQPDLFKITELGSLPSLTTVLL